MKKKKIVLYLCLLCILCFGGGFLYAHAEEKPAITEKYLTSDGAVLYVKNLPDNTNIENTVYQVGTESCTISEISTLEESAESIYTLILCDTSLSTMRKSADKMKEVLKDVVANRMTGEKFAMMGMGKDAQLLCDYTNDYLVLKNVIDGMTEEKQKTYVFSSLYQAIEDLGALEDSYKRIIVITDGVDSGGVGYGQAELEKKLEEISYPIYALGISGKNNQADLQILYAISRATAAECFTLNETENLLDIVQALSRDYKWKRIVVKFPESLMDGSTKNSLLRAEINGSTYQAQTQITLPFILTKDEVDRTGEKDNGGGKHMEGEDERENDETNSAEGERPKEDNVDNTNNGVETGSGDKTDKQDKMNIFGMAIPKSIFLGGVIVLCVCVCGIIFVLIRKRRKEKVQEQQVPPKPPYEVLDQKLMANQNQGGTEENPPISSNEKPKRGGTQILAHVSMEAQGENNNQRIIKRRQHTLTLTDVKNAGRHWQCQFGEAVVVGRNSESCRLVIPDDRAVSDQHCEFSVEDDMFYIKDMASSNGTRLNGSRIEPQKSIRISDGAVLEIGRFKYQVGLE